MWLRFAVTAAATITAMSAQTWEVGPIGGYLKLSSKFIGSANTNDPKTDDTKLHSLQPAYGAFITRNTKGYYGFELDFLRSKARMDSKLIPSSSTDRVSESGTVYLNQLSVNETVAWRFDQTTGTTDTDTVSGLVLTSAGAQAVDWVMGIIPDR